MAPFKTYTDYDLEHMEELQRVVGRHFTRKQTTRRRAFFLSWGGVCLPVGLYLAVRKDSVAAALICCVVGCLLLASGLFYYQLQAWRSCRGMGDEPARSDFAVDKTGIVVSRGKNGQRIPYQECAYLLETAKNFYVVTAGGQGLILDKEHVRGGTAEELRAWLEKKCGIETTWAGRGKAPGRT